MLPQVSAVLRKFVSPIGSTKQAARSDGEGDSSGSGLSYNGNDFKRQTEGDSTPSQNQTKDSNVSLEESGVKEKQPSELKEVKASLNGVTASFIQLLNNLQENSDTVVKWLAPKTYADSEKKLKKGSKLRKGMVVDDKID